MEKVVGRQGAYEEFFRQLILLSHVLTTTGSYRNFSELAPVAFAQVCSNSGVTGQKADVAPDAFDQVKAAMGKLVAHADVASGLDSMLSCCRMPGGGYDLALWTRRCSRPWCRWVDPRTRAPPSRRTPPASGRTSDV